MKSFKNLAGKGLALFGSVAAAASAHAHPGHDLLEHGTRHAFSSPDHLMVMGVSGLFLVCFGLIAQKKQLRRALIGSGSLAMAAAAVLWLVA